MLDDARSEADNCEKSGYRAAASRLHVSEQGGGVSATVAAAPGRAGRVGRGIVRSPTLPHSERVSVHVKMKFVTPRVRGRADSLSAAPRDAGGGGAEASDAFADGAGDDGGARSRGVRAEGVRPCSPRRHHRSVIPVVVRGQKDRQRGSSCWSGDADTGARSPPAAGPKAGSPPPRPLHSARRPSINRLRLLSDASCTAI